MLYAALAILALTLVLAVIVWRKTHPHTQRSLTPTPSHRFIPRYPDYIDPASVSAMPEMG